MTLGTQQNDLYSGLISTKFKRKQFWGIYDDLNYIKIPSSEDSLYLQLAHLRNYLQTQNINFSNIENFLNQVQKGQAGSLENDISSLASEKIYSRIIQILNTGLWGNIEQNVYRQHNVEDMISQEKKNAIIESRMEEITRLLEQASISGKLSQKLAIILEKQLREGHLTKSVTEGITNYVLVKADLAEQLMAEVLENSNPNWKAIQTGAMLFSGKQLIEDAMTFDLSNNIKFKPAEFSIKQNNTVTRYMVDNVKDFLTNIEKLDGHYSISLSENLYLALQQAAVLKAQAKSGHLNKWGPQRIINENQKNRLSLYQSLPYENYYKLCYLYQQDQKFFRRKQHSEALAALANYTLSKAITKTALVQNDVYFTEQGIFTADLWMKKYQYYLKFKSDVTKIDERTLIAKRNYVLAHI